MCIRDSLTTTQPILNQSCSKYYLKLFWQSHTTPRPLSRESQVEAAEKVILGFLQIFFETYGRNNQYRVDETKEE